MVPTSKTSFFVCLFFLRSWIQQGSVPKGVRQELFTCSLWHPPLPQPPSKLLYLMKYSCFAVSQRYCGRWCFGSLPHKHFWRLLFMSASIWAGRHTSCIITPWRCKMGKARETPRARHPHPLVMFDLFLRVAAPWALGFWQSQALQCAWMVWVFKGPF